MNFQATSLGMVLGLLMISQDLNTYYLYILLLSCDPKTITCENFLSYYTFFALVNTLLTLVAYPTSGFITDKTDKSSFRVFIISNIIQTLSIFCQIISAIHPMSYLFLFVFWQISQLISIQNSNSLWKIIKQFSSNVDTEFTVTHIGNIGDLTSDILESTLLAILAVLMTQTNISYHGVVIYMFVVIMGLNCILIGVSIYLSTRIRLESMDLSEAVYAPVPENKLNLGTWLKASIRDFWRQKFSLHVFLHCMILILYSALVQYPLSFQEVNIIDTKNTKFCHGVLTNLIVLGAMTNGLYLVGSISYRLFLVKMSAPKFYRYLYPSMAFILIGLTVTLKFQLNPLIIFFCTSSAVVIPYYMYYYDYYTFTEMGKTELYGFTLGLYGLISTICTILGQGIYYVNLELEYLIVILIVLLGFTMVYSWYIRTLC